MTQTQITMGQCGLRQVDCREIFALIPPSSPQHTHSSEGLPARDLPTSTHLFLLYCIPTHTGYTVTPHIQFIQGLRQYLQIYLEHIHFSLPFLSLCYRFAFMSYGAVLQFVSRITCLVLYNLLFP